MVTMIIFRKFLQGDFRQPRQYVPPQTKIEAEYRPFEKGTIIWTKPPLVVGSQSCFMVCTPWKTNIEPENDGLEDDFLFQLGDF